MHGAIIQEGDPVLRKVAERVPLSDIGSKHVQHILARMRDALSKEADGVAIAAPQIGVPLRIFVVAKSAFVIANEEKRKKGKDASLGTPEKDLVCINPEITKLSKKKVKLPEGCLSVRWTYGTTMRHEKATLTAYDEHGRRFTYGGSGLIAQIFQHETDHLNGILFIDHAKDLETLTPAQIAEMETKQKTHHEQ